MFRPRRFFPFRISFPKASHVVNEERTGLLEANAFEMEDATVDHETGRKMGSSTHRHHQIEAEGTNDIGAPSAEVTQKWQSLSDIFTIVCAGFALISDGYRNNLMKTTNGVLKSEYKKQYTSRWSTQVANALLGGEILGRLTIGLICDYIGQKFTILLITAAIVVGGILATASIESTINGMFWMLTISRGIVGFSTAGEYPASSTSASETANEHTLEQRGPIFILVTNLPPSFSGPLTVSIFLIVLSAAGTSHLSMGWRVCFGIGVLFPLSVFYFRLEMLNSELYRRGVIKRRVPFMLVLVVMTADFPSHETSAFSPEKLHEFAASAEHSVMKRENQYCSARHLLGISAALRKAAATIGAEVFTPIQNHLEQRTSIIAAICGLVGILIT